MELPAFYCPTIYHLAPRASQPSQILCMRHSCLPISHPAFFSRLLFLGGWLSGRKACTTYRRTLLFFLLTCGLLRCFMKENTLQWCRGNVLNCYFLLPAIIPHWNKRLYFFLFNDIFMVPKRLSWLFIFILVSVHCLLDVCDIYRMNEATRLNELLWGSNMKSQVWQQVATATVPSGMHARQPAVKWWPPTLRS